MKKYKQLFGKKDRPRADVLGTWKGYENGNSVINLSFSDGIKTMSKEFNLNVEPVNDPPTIVDIPNQTLLENETVKEIIFSVDEGGGSDEDIQSLSVTARSTNTALLPKQKIKINYF